MRWLELKVPPVAALAVTAVLMAVAPGAQMPPSGLRWLAGGLLAVAGAAIALAGVAAFRRSRTTVNPMTPQASSSIVMDGVYRHTRNPMYLGFVLVLAGWAVVLGSGWGWLLVALFAAWLTRFQIVPEERVLAARFGSAFEDYRRKVRRWV